MKVGIYFIITFVLACVMLYVIKGFHLDSGNVIGVLIGDFIMTLIYRKGLSRGR